MDNQKKANDTRFQNMEMTLKQVQERQTATDTIVINLHAQMQHKLSSQPFNKSKENESIMTLGSGKEWKELRKSGEVEQEIEVKLHEGEVKRREERDVIDVACFRHRGRALSTPLIT